MSKKVFTSMKDENPDLQKQMGCISGFFHLFERHWFLTGSHNQNKPPPGETSNEVKEPNSTMQKANNVKLARQNQQFSTESSGTSMSPSSCSSSMSSLEFNRTILSQIKITENSKTGAAVKQLENPGHQSLDFCDIVKDSMQREARGLSVKTAAKDEKKGRILKYIDSPRPLLAPNSVNTGVVVANEPFHILAKSQKAPWDSPRHSYDERDIQQIFKCAAKHKEIPRLSLDSREGSKKGFNEATRAHNLLKGAQKGHGSSSTMLRQQQQEPETSKRPSRVVAKLMGLEAFPDWTQTCDTPPQMSSCSTNRNEIKKPDASQDSQLQVSKGSESSIKTSNPSISVYGEIEKRMADLQFKNSGKDLRALKQILEAMQRYKDSLDITRDQASNYPSDRSLSKSSKSQSPRMQEMDPTSVTDKMSNSTRGSKLPIVIMKPAQVTRKTNNPASTEMSVHGKSGLSKFSLGNPKNGRMVDKLDRQTAKGISPTIRHIKDPFSQPFHSADKSNKMRTSKLMQSSKVPQIINGENTSSSTHTAETRSPRVQKKFGLERRSPTSPSSDSSSNRRQHKQLMESSSPSTTPRQKISTLQQRNERFSKISCQRRDFKHEVDVMSSDLQQRNERFSKISCQRRDFKHEVDAMSSDFDSNRSMDSHSDLEAIQVDHSENNSSISIQLNGLNQNNAAKELSKESVMTETIVTAEQPSPVSVLDPAFYKEDPPSPIKKKSEIPRDLDEALNTYDSMEDISDLTLSSTTTEAEFSNGTSDNDFQTQNLVQILQQIDYNDEKFTNFRGSKDADHKYISEILVASGLLSSHSSSQVVHSPSHPIDPKLFLALELIKTNKMHFNIRKIVRMNNPEEMQRKLIFDAVNDILLQKLILESSSTRWWLSNQPAGHKLNGQQLLDEICTEIDKLQSKNRNVGVANEDENLTSLLWGDLMHHPTTWTECNHEIPNIVLDIERLIFKDLITEVVRGEVANHRGKHCRQLLFPK